MKKYISMALLLILLIASVVGNVLLANKWIQNKNKVIELAAKIDVLATQEETEKPEEDVKPEEVEQPDEEPTIFEVPHVDIEVNSDKIAQRYFYVKGDNGVTFSYAKHSTDKTQEKKINIHNSNDKSSYSIEVDKEVADLNLILTANATDIYNIYVLFVDGTVKVLTNQNINTKNFVLEDVASVKDKKVVRVEQILKYVEEDKNTTNPAPAFVLEDGTIVTE